MLIMTAGISILPVMDAIAKYLTDEMPPVEIAFFRFGWQAVLSLLALALLGRLALALKRPLWPNIVRGILFATASVLMFTALKVMGIAEAIAIFFVEPLILTLMSAAILREPVGPRRYVAIAVGFFGAVLIIQPSWDVFGFYALLPLAAAFFFASYLLMTRRFSTQQDPFAMQFVAGLGGVAWLGLIQLGGTAAGFSEFTPVLPSIEALWLLAAAGFIGFLGHVAIVVAFSRAPASVLAPINYLELPMSVLVGYLVFRDLPNTTAVAGIALIAASGLYVMYREQAIKTTSNHDNSTQ